MYNALCIRCMHIACQKKSRIGKERIRSVPPLFTINDFIRCVSSTGVRDDPHDFYVYSVLVAAEILEGLSPPTGWVVKFKSAKLPPLADLGKAGPVHHILQH